MMYEKPEVCSQSMQVEYFNLMLKMMTHLGKSVKAEELPKILKFAKKAAVYCSDVVRNDTHILTNKEAKDFWDKVYETSNK